MNRFSLSVNKKMSLPDTVTVDGSDFSINTDFRVILNCLKLQTDTEIIERDRTGILCRLFYVDRVPNNPKQGLENFLNIEKPDEDEPPPLPQFCFEYDADVLFTSFLQDYNIDLTEIPYLHWHKFKMMLQGLSADSPFNNRIRLRFMDLKNFKGEERAKMEKVKQAVQLPVILTAKEIEEQHEFQREWGE